MQATAHAKLVFKNGFPVNGTCLYLAFFDFTLTLPFRSFGSPDLIGFCMELCYLNNLLISVDYIFNI